MPYQQLEGYVPEEEKNEEEEISNPNITHGTRLWSLISIILSAVGIILILVPIVGVFFGIFGVGFAVYSRKKNDYFYTEAVIGIILGAVAVASCAFFIIYNAMNEAGMVVNIFNELLK